MAIPVYMQQFKAAGIYRVVFDKSTVLSQPAATLRLVVGYSPKGPFNVPVYVTSIGQFRELFGEGTKTLEKRGCYFHRIAEQCLADSAILCLNLKKFANEKITASTVDTNFNVKNPIDTVKVPVEDIYDTTRFWTLSADKLNEIRGAEYINIATTNTKQTSATYFIRKASGSKVSGYNITVSDWYKSTGEEIPEFLQGYENNLMSDFMAEVYVFNGRFIVDQVLASDVLKKYFAVDKKAGTLKLRQYVKDGFGDYVDTLDALYSEEASGALGHYIGSLIPYFTDKQGVYKALDIVFNQDQDVHNMMMSFNVDMLEEDGIANIDLSGSRFIATAADHGDKGAHELANEYKSYGSAVVCIEDIFAGTAKTNLLGNVSSPVVADKIQFHPSILKENGKPKYELAYEGTKKVTGTLYVSGYEADDEYDKEKGKWCVSTEREITLKQVQPKDDDKDIIIKVPAGASIGKVLYQLGAAYKDDTDPDNIIYVPYKNWDADEKFKGVSGNGLGSYYADDDPYGDYNNLEGPKKVITSLNRDIDTEGNDATIELSGDVIKCTVEEVFIVTSSEYCSGIAEDENSYSGVLVNPEIKNESWNVYGSSVSFIEFDNDNWKIYQDTALDADTELNTYTIYAPANIANSLGAIISKGDRFLAVDGKVDMDGDGDYEDEIKNGYYDLVYVEDVETKYDEFGVPVYHQIKFTGEVQVFEEFGNSIRESQLEIEEGMPDYAAAMVYSVDEEGAVDTPKYYLVRVDRPLNQEIGVMTPVYLEGYTYENPKPNGTGMMAKLDWQNFMLSAITEYKGLRTGLLNKSEIDYRYVVDTFESYVDSSLKSVLTQLCKDKQSAFAILNFPSARTFVKCPYTSFTDDKGVFNIQYVVDGKNKKKAAAKGFGLPSDAEGASYAAFYTPLKFSDGYVDSIVPSAGIVSNLFMEKYRSRQPYYIIAGPNYGAISASGLIGPDYNYSMDELQIIEPYGVNCMVYRPGFGTFINANQTAKQTPKSALSSVNVRELVIYIMDEVERILQAYQWEFNNQQVRNAIKDRADAVCTRVQANGGIQRFLNVMDESNNDADIIDNEMAVLSTHIEPGRGMGKMVHELTLYRTGGMSSAIVSE